MEAKQQVLFTAPTAKLPFTDDSELWEVLGSSKQRPRRRTSGSLERVQEWGSKVEGSQGTARNSAQAYRAQGAGMRRSR